MKPNSQIKQKPEQILEEHGHITIRPATSADVNAMVILSDQQRKANERANPQFWRRAKNANENQAKWFDWLLSRGIGILLIAEINNCIKGFVFGKVTAGADVYDSGGFTLIIEDFCIDASCSWESIGTQLLHEVQKGAKNNGASQVLFICESYDKSRKEFLESKGFRVVTESYLKQIS